MNHIKSCNRRQKWLKVNNVRSYSFFLISNSSIFKYKSLMRWKVDTYYFLLKWIVYYQTSCKRYLAVMLMLTVDALISLSNEYLITWLCVRELRLMIKWAFDIINFWITIFIYWKDRGLIVQIGTISYRLYITNIRAV